MKKGVGRMAAKAAQYFQKLRFCLYIIFNPFKGFWEMKREKRGSLAAANTILALAVISFVAKTQYLGFIFNPTYFQSVDFTLEALKLLVPIGLWCVANYCLTTLMDGEGSFREIVMATGYATTPIVLIYLPMTILSHFLTENESAFVTLANTVVILWVAFLLLAGMLEIHQYTMLKTLVTTLLTIAGIAVMIFLGLLLVSLLDQMWSFVSDLYQEISLRLR